MLCTNLKQYQSHLDLRCEANYTGNSPLPSVFQGKQVIIKIMGSSEKEKQAVVRKPC